MQVANGVEEAFGLSAEWVVDVEDLGDRIVAYFYVTVDGEDATPVENQHETISYATRMAKACARSSVRGE